MPYSVTATADVANGRVQIDAQGGVPGETLYLFRRDSGGVAVVRDTSGGDVVWPASGGTVATNELLNPRHETTTAAALLITQHVTNPRFELNTTGWASSGAVTSFTRTQDLVNPALPGCTWFGRLVTTSGAAAVNGSVTIPVTAAEAFHAEMRVRGTPGTQVQLRITWTGATATSTSLLTLGSTTAWQLLQFDGAVPAGATAARVDLLRSSGGVATIDMTAVNYLRGIGGRPVWGYADGAQVEVADPDLITAWTGTADGSTSTLSALGMANAPGGFFGGNLLRWSSTVGPRSGSRSLAVMRRLTGSAGSIYTNTTPILAGQWLTFAVSVKVTAGSPYVVAVRTSGGGNAPGIVSTVGTGTWVDHVITAQAGADGALIGGQVYLTTGGAAAIGDVMWTDDATVIVGPTAWTGGAFNGDTPDQPSYAFAWTGAADASTSTATATGLLVVYDNEARQGLQTDYILADANGVQLGVYRIDVPLWGTWLKSPGRPYLNTRCIFGSEAPVVRKARRASIDIEGAAQPIVLSEARSSRGGALTLAALTLAQAQAIDRLLDDGTTLMLDTPPSWGVAFRYISVGDSTSTRGLSDGQLGLERTERVFSLADVLHVDAPIGVTVVDPGRTYATLPVLYGNYAALAAINPDYLALALGSAD